MSSFHSDKCTKKELKAFRYEVLKWLTKHFNISGMKIKAYTCYNGDVRIYTGYNEFPNRKSSFRKTEPEKNESGKIIGWHGTRGIHTIRNAEYISINRDEFVEIKKAFEAKDAFYWDLIFRKLTPLISSK
jgi:hypothetical protein